MTIQSEYLSFLVSITGVPNIVTNFKTEQDVKKNISDIRYLRFLPNDAVKLAYVGSNELNVTNNLYINDKSDELWGNAKTKDIIEFISETNPIDVKTQNFLVTQIYTESGLEKNPLFFKYIFQENASQINRNSIKIFDKDFIEIPENKYKIEYLYNYNDDGVPESEPSRYVIYNDLENKYNKETGEIEVYFIQYTLSDTNTNVTILLDNEPAYLESTLDDIWPLTGQLKPWRTVYTLEDGLSVRMSKNIPTYVRYIETKRIKLDYPTNLTNIDSWQPKIINGKFTSAYDNYSLIYEIKEFSDQSFNPIEPYKLSSRVLCKKISKNLIKFPNEQIKSGAVYSYIDIIISDQDGIEKYAITNNPEKEGLDYVNFDTERIYIDGTPLRWDTSLFLSIDKYNGIVHVDVDLLDTDLIYSNYTYLESSYVIKNLNLNPVFDNDAEKEIKVIYLIPSNCPTNPSVSSQVKSINYLKVNRSGKIIATSQDGIGGNTKLNKEIKLTDTEGTSLNGILGMYYSWTASTTSTKLQEIYYNNKIYVNSTINFPKTGWIKFIDNSTASVDGSGITRYAKYTKKTDTYLLLSNQELEVPDNSSGILIDSGATIELVNFIEERSTNSNRVSLYELNHRPSTSVIPVHYSRYFILGEISINAPHKPSDSILYDIRVNGGGIKEDKYLEAKYKNERATWVNDKNKYNGQIYPGNAVIIVKLPESIKEQFSEDQIQDIIEENIPFGVMPVIEYYGYKPEIISVEPI